METEGSPERGGATGEVGVDSDGLGGATSERGGTSVPLTSMVVGGASAVVGGDPSVVGGTSDRLTSMAEGGAFAGVGGASAEVGGAPPPLISVGVGGTSGEVGGAEGGVGVAASPKPRPPQVLLELDSLSDIVSTLHLDSPRLRCVSVSVSARWLALVSSGGGVHLCLRSPSLVYRHSLPQREGAAVLVSCCPHDERYIAVATSEGSVCLWETRGEGCPRRLRVSCLHRGSRVSALAWDEAEARVYAGDSDGRVSVTALGQLQRGVGGGGGAGGGGGGGLTLFPTRVIVTLPSPVQQLHHSVSHLVVSALTHCYVCDTQREKFWTVGTKARCGSYGACLFPAFTPLLPQHQHQHHHQQHHHRRSVVVSARPGGRVWVAECGGNVTSTVQLRHLLPQTSTALYSCREDSVRQSPGLQALAFHQLLPMGVSRLLLCSSDGIIILSPRRNVIIASAHIPGLQSVSVCGREILCLRGDGRLSHMTLVSPSVAVETLARSRRIMAAACLALTHRSPIMAAPARRRIPTSILEEICEGLESSAEFPAPCADGIPKNSQIPAKDSQVPTAPRPGPSSLSEISGMPADVLGISGISGNSGNVGMSGISGDSGDVETPGNYENLGIPELPGNPGNVLISEIPGNSRNAETPGNSENVLTSENPEISGSSWNSGISGNSGMFGNSENSGIPDVPRGDLGEAEWRRELSRGIRELLGMLEAESWERGNYSGNSGSSLSSSRRSSVSSQGSFYLLDGGIYQVNSTDDHPSSTTTTTTSSSSSTSSSTSLVHPCSAAFVSPPPNPEQQAAPNPGNKTRGDSELDVSPSTSSSTFSASYTNTTTSSLNIITLSSSTSSTSSTITSGGAAVGKTRAWPGLEEVVEVVVVEEVEVSGASNTQVRSGEDDGRMEDVHKTLGESRTPLSLSARLLKTNRLGDTIGTSIRDRIERGGSLLQSLLSTRHGGDTGRHGGDTGRHGGDTCTEVSLPSQAIVSQAAGMADERDVEEAASMQMEETDERFEDLKTSTADTLVKIEDPTNFLDPTVLHKILSQWQHHLHNITLRDGGGDGDTGTSLDLSHHLPLSLKADVSRLATLLFEVMLVMGDGDDDGDDDDEDGDYCVDDRDNDGDNDDDRDSDDHGGDGETMGHATEFLRRYLHLIDRCRAQEAVMRLLRGGRMRGEDGDILRRMLRVIQPSILDTELFPLSTQREILTRPSRGEILSSLAESGDWESLLSGPTGSTPDTEADWIYLIKVTRGLKGTPAGGVTAVPQDLDTAPLKGTPGLESLKGTLDFEGSSVETGAGGVKTAPQELDITPLKGTSGLEPLKGTLDFEGSSVEIEAGGVTAVQQELDTSLKGTPAVEGSLKGTPLSGVAVALLFRAGFLRAEALLSKAGVPLTELDEGASVERGLLHAEALLSEAGVPLAEAGVPLTELRERAFLRRWEALRIAEHRQRSLIQTMLERTDRLMWTQQL